MHAYELCGAAVGGAVALANNDFAKLLHGCILDELEELIGESATKFLFFRLKLDRHVENPREFHRRLESVLSEGAVVLERSIVGGLFRRLNVSCEEASPFEFGRCVDCARKIFAAEMKGE